MSVPGSPAAGPRAAGDPPALAALDPGGWAPYLDPGERLLWEGAPAAGIRFRPSDVFMVPFSIFWAGFAVVWEVMVIAMGAPWFMALFGLPFVAVGAYITVGRFFWDARVRAGTRYALTDRRAFVAQGWPRRRLRSWPIGPDSPIDYRPGPEASLFLAREAVPVARASRHPGRGGRLHMQRHGFEFIADGDRVYALVRAVQRTQAAGGGAGR